MMRSASSRPARIGCRGDSSRKYEFCMRASRSEEHTSELQSLTNLVCRLLLEKKKHEYEAEPMTASVASAHRAHGSHAATATHDKHAGHSVEMFRQKLSATIMLTSPTIVWSPL